MERRGVAVAGILTVFVSIFLINMSFMRSGNSIIGFLTKIIHSGVQYENPNPLKDVPELRELQVMDLIDISKVPVTLVSMYSYEYHAPKHRMPWHTRLYACVLTLVDARKYCVHKFPEDMNKLLVPEGSEHEMCAAESQQHCEVAADVASGSYRKDSGFESVKLDEKVTGQQAGLHQHHQPDSLIPVSSSSVEHRLPAAGSDSDRMPVDMEADKEFEAGRVVVVEWTGEPKGWKLEQEKPVVKSTLAEFVKICGDRFDAQKDWSKSAAERMMQLE